MYKIMGGQGTIGGFISKNGIKNWNLWENETKTETKSCEIKKWPKRGPANTFS